MPMVSLSEAAAALGVSVDTVVRRIRAGKLRGEKDDAGRWVVWLDDFPSTAAHHTPPLNLGRLIEEDAAAQLEQQRIRLELAAALEMVASLRADKDRLEARIDRAEDERSELRRMLFLEQQTVASLRALLPAPTEDAEHEPQPAEQRPAPAPQRRPWWKVWGG
jgi:excisionase family DNA binding protein